MACPCLALTCCLLRGVHQLEISVDHLADDLLEAFRGSPAKFLPDLAGVTTLLGRVDGTLEPRVDFHEGAPVSDANVAERSRDEVGNGVALATCHYEVVGYRMATDKLQRAR